MNTKSNQDFGALLPVVTLGNPSDAHWIVEVLVEAGYKAIEITLRTDRAIESLSAALSVAPSDFRVGAGTVLNSDQVKAVKDLGAAFVVSPGYSDEIVATCQNVSIDVIPGVGSASDAMRAVKDGISRVKVFPARELGGPNFIKAISAPFPNLRFLPSGGVTAADARHYLAIPAVFAISGSWMIDREIMEKRHFIAAVDKCRKALLSVQQVK